MPFRIAKLGHVVLNVTDLERAVMFDTQVLGFSVSDVYPSEMMPGGMVFMRNADHHGVALVGSLTRASESLELNHLAFEVATLDEVVRARSLAAARRRDRFRGLAPRRLPDRRRIPRSGRAPAGDLLEIYWGVDQVGSEGVVRPSGEWKGAHSLAAAIADPVHGQDTTRQDPTLVDK